MHYNLTTFLRLLFLICALWLTITSPVFALSPADITLAWDANSENNLAGYKIYYKTGSPVVENDPQASTIDVPLATLDDPDHPEYSIADLDPDKNYFFAVTAYSSEDSPKESGLSNGASTLRITEPDDNFTINSNDKSTHYKLKGRGVPDKAIEIMANSNRLMGTVFADADGGWAKHIDFSSIEDGLLSLTIVQDGVTSFPIAGSLDLAAPQIISTPTVSNMGDTYAIIEWETDETSTGSVEYGFDQTYGWTVSETGRTQHHSITLTDLVAGARYDFRVNAVDSAGNGPDADPSDTNPSGNYSFMTIPAVPPKVVDSAIIDYEWNGIQIQFDKPDMQGATDEGNYRFSPSLNFLTSQSFADDIFFIDDFTVILRMRSIPIHEILTLTLTNITDSSGNPLTPASITINDNDNDRIADDWEQANMLDYADASDQTEDPDQDGYSNLQEYQTLTNPQSKLEAPFFVKNTIPLDNAGVGFSSRVPDRTSVAFLIESQNGIDTRPGADADRIRFTIEDGAYGTYEADMDSVAVRTVKLSDDPDNSVKLLWVIYDRSMEIYMPDSYSFGSMIQVDLDIVDAEDQPMRTASIVFRVESEAVHVAAQNNLPQTVELAIDDLNHDAGIEIVGGELDGAKIIYSSSEPLTPEFGASLELQAVEACCNLNAVGLPLNLLPHTVFNTPVKVYIPLPGLSDLSNISLLYFNGLEWRPACDADGTVLDGGNGWMVPNSRINHDNQIPPSIEIRVYHFSGIQAVGPPSPDKAASNTGENSPSNTPSSGGGGGGGGGCFIGSADAGQEPIGLLSLLGWVWLIMLIGLIGLFTEQLLSSRLPAKPA